jgi:hypothetical protein
VYSPTKVIGCAKNVLVGEKFPLVVLHQTKIKIKLCINASCVSTLRHFIF